jgi:hypothetical protein
MQKRILYRSADIVIIKKEELYMNNDVNKKLQDILSSLDQNTLKNGAQSVGQFLNTKEGQKVKQKLAGIDKQKVVDTFSKMDAGEIKKKLAQADLSKFKNMSADEIVNKFKKL